MIQNMSKENIKDYTLEELKKVMSDLNEPAYRAGQIFDWLYDNDAKDFDVMTNLSKDLRAELSERYYIFRSDIIDEKNMRDSTKYLITLEDNNLIETVLLRYKYGYTLCVSSQVGCKMGCGFCASTVNGFIRNLKPGEMLEQILTVERQNKVRVSRIVIMGSGEPLDNYENVMRFIRIINDKHGLNIGARHITISTCGIVPGIYKLSEENLQLTLAISLHAVTDDKRRSIMPVNKVYPIKDIISAVKYFVERTNRRVTFEYTMIEGFNDTEKDASELALLTKGILCNVNLIPVNIVKEKGFLPSSPNTIAKFKNKLEEYGVNVTVRRSLGEDIDAACGQLRSSYMKNQE